MSRRKNIRNKDSTKTKSLSEQKMMEEDNAFIISTKKNKNKNKYTIRSKDKLDSFLCICQGEKNNFENKTAYHVIA